VVHWTDHGGTSRLIVDELTALTQLSECTSPELVAASADSLVHQRLATRSAIAKVATRLPAATRRAVAHADGICESGTETLFWLRMGSVISRRQVWLAPDIRVDFLLGERLVIEVDGEEFHSREGDFEADRRRDAALSAFGYRVLRFSYRQVMFDWPQVDSAVWAAVARGDRY
jgi:very-short-patch-repair endonuclease